MRTPLIKEQMNTIAQHIPNIYAMSITSVDGLYVGSWMPGPPEILEAYENADEDRFGAMSAAIISLGERVSSELRCGANQLTILRGDRGIIFNILLGEYTLTFGVRQLRTIGSVLVILQQHWNELLSLLDVPAPKL